MTMFKKWLVLWLFSLLLVLSGCATNPVTGENELSLVSEKTELDIGNKQYQPSRQMQGGDYILEPELTQYVQRIGNRLASVSDRKLPYEFVIINDSTPNAWALPGGKIAIHRGLLLELKSEAELAAVIGHEIVHAAARHGAKGMERGMLLQGALIAAGVASSDSNYSQLVVGAASLGANLVNQSYSRGAELEADFHGIRYMSRAGYDPHAAVHLQETFVRLSKNQKSDALAGLFASHPPSQERVNKNRESVAQLAAGGDIGAARYQKMIARLKRNKPAYSAYEKGRGLLKKKQPKKALIQARKAIKIEPKEALFYSLRGDALLLNKRNRKALAAYNRAVHLNGDFFGHYLKRGRLKQLRGDSVGARSDLLQSIKLLPTATAHYFLGRQYAEEGDRQRAIAHYNKAAGSKSNEGLAAGKALVRLDLPKNPGRYIHSRLALDRQGFVVIQIENSSQLSVDSIRVVAGLKSSKGGLERTQEFRLSKRLPAGKKAQLRTQVQLADRKQLSRLGSQIVSARVSR